MVQPTRSGHDPWVRLHQGRVHFKIKRSSGLICALVLGVFCAYLALSVYQRPAWRRSVIRRVVMRLPTVPLEQVPPERTTEDVRREEQQPSADPMDMGQTDSFGEKILNRRGLGLHGQAEEAAKWPVNMAAGFDVILNALGESLVRVFQQADRNKDLYLDPVEFREVLNQVQSPKKFVNQAKFLTVDSQEPGVNLRCQYSPLELDTMTKILDEHRGTNVHYMEGLKAWRGCAHPTARFAQSLLLEGLLPRDAAKREAAKVGDVYYVVEPPPSRTIYNRNSLPEDDIIHQESCNRVYPPNYTHKGAKLVQNLLMMFHENAFSSTRHPPHGSVAMIRAKNSKYMEITFRLHGEFQLNEPPNFPFWFTPAFFYGSMIVDRAATKIYSFQMANPRKPEKKLNIDMEWNQQPMGHLPDSDTNIEVDIGYTDAMEVHSEGEGVSPGSWSEEVSEVRAFHLLEAEMLPFNRVPYLQFGEAFTKAAAQSKLVHSVVLWGSLNDQSC